MSDEPVKEETTPAPAEAHAGAVDTFQNTMDKFFSIANVNAVFSRPVRQGEQTVINCSELVSAMGFGIGEGSGEGGEGESVGRGSGSGGGGGGQTFARPVAAIVISPTGVTVKPILDPTKLGIAALTTLGFMFATLARLRRGH